MKKDEGWRTKLAGVGKDEEDNKLAGVGKAEVGQAGKIGNLKSTKMKN